MVVGMTGTVEIRCPQCNYWLGEATYYARLVCPKCGSEVSYRSKEERGLTRRKPAPTIEPTE